MSDDDEFPTIPDGGSIAQPKSPLEVWRYCVRAAAYYERRAAELLESGLTVDAAIQQRKATGRIVSQRCGKDWQKMDVTPTMEMEARRMAKYSDGSDVIVGDVVKCALPGCNCSDDDVIEAISGSNVRRSGCIHFVESNSFELVSRAPSPEPEQPAVNNEQSPPLVVWPEETPTIYKDLNPGERFVFASSPQVVRMIIDGGNYVITDKSNDPYYNQIGYVSFAEADYPVRRVKYVTAPQFTVI